MSRRVCWVLALLAAQASAANIEAVAAWRGWAGAGGLGELELRVPASAIAGTVTVSLQSPLQHLDSTATAHAGAYTVLRLPARADAPVALTARNPDGRTVRGQFSFQRSDRPILVWAGNTAVEAANADVHLLAVSAADMPRLASSYTSVAGIVIDDATLRLLDDSQAAALLQYVRHCGFTMAVGFSAEADTALLRAAGCDGRQLRAGLAGLTPTAAIGQFLDRTAAAPIGSTTLSSLANVDRRAIWLTGALLLYVLLAVALLLLWPRPAMLLGLAPLATVAMALMFYLAPVQQQLIVWAEARSGDRSAQFSGELQLRPTAPGRLSVVVPAQIDHADACDASTQSTAHWDAAQQRIVSAELRLQLLLQPQLCFSGSFPLNYRAQAQRIDAATLQVTNNGAAAWHAARLLWQGRVYRDLELSASDVQRIRATSGSATATPAERLASERLPWGEAAVLLPLPLAALNLPSRSASGWLAIAMPVTARQPP